MGINIRDLMFSMKSRVCSCNCFLYLGQNLNDNKLLYVICLFSS